MSRPLRACPVSMQDVRGSDTHTRQMISRKTNNSLILQSTSVREQDITFVVARKFNIRNVRRVDYWTTNRLSRRGAMCCSAGEQTLCWHRSKGLQSLDKKTLPLLAFLWHVLRLFVALFPISNLVFPFCTIVCSQGAYGTIVQLISEM